jgi:hypothetical protein
MGDRNVAAIAKRGTLGFMLALVAASLFLALIFRVSDDAIYARYLETFARSGRFPPDYPLAALGVLVLGVIPPIAPFGMIFAGWMLIVVTASRVFIERWISRQAARTYSLLLIAGCAGTVLFRFDAVPAALTVLALVAMEKKRWALCALAIGAATAMKLYPAVLLPVVLALRLRDNAVAEQTDDTSGKWRDVGVMGAVFMTVMTLGLILPAVISTQAIHSASFLAGGAARPVEIESMPGTLLWLSHLAGVPLATVDSYGSRNYASPLEPPLRIASVILILAGLSYVYWGVWRGIFKGRQAFLLAVGILVSTSKVFSPQYLIWLIPLVAITARLSLDWILVAALTLLEYPVLFSVAALDLRPSSGLFLAFAIVLVLRNMALVIAVGRFAWNAAQESAPVMSPATVGSSP